MLGGGGEMVVGGWRRKCVELRGMSGRVDGDGSGFEEDLVGAGSEEDGENVEDRSAIEPDEPLPLFHPEGSALGQKLGERTTGLSDLSEVRGKEAESGGEFDGDELDGDVGREKGGGGGRIFFEIGIVKLIGADIADAERDAGGSSADEDDLSEARGEIGPKVEEGGEIGEGAEGQVGDGNGGAFQCFDEGITGWGGAEMLRRRGSAVDFDVGKVGDLEDCAGDGVGPMEGRIAVGGGDSENGDFGRVEGEGEGKGIVGVMEGETDGGVGIDPDGRGGGGRHKKSLGVF